MPVTYHGHSRVLREGALKISMETVLTTKIFFPSMVLPLRALGSFSGLCLSLSPPEGEVKQAKQFLQSSGTYREDKSRMERCSTDPIRFYLPGVYELQAHEGNVVGEDANSVPPLQVSANLESQRRQCLAL